MAGPARMAAWMAGLTGAKRAVTAALLGAVSVLAFAPVHFWPVLFVSLGGLVWLLDGSYRGGATRATQSLGAALTGFWFGFGFFLTGLYWVAEAFLVEPWRHGWLIPLVMTALPAGMALFFAAGCTVAMLLWCPGPARVFALAIGIGLAEFARGHVLTGFPWNLIGYGLLFDTASMQLAAVLGVYAITVLAVLLFAAPAAIWDGEDRHNLGTVLLTGVLLTMFGGSYVWGSVRLANAPDASSDVRLRLVQPNVNQAEKWRPENATGIFETYLNMTQRRGLESIDIVVWPETALPFPLDKSPDALAAIGEILPARTVLLLGSARWAEERNDQGILVNRNAYNSLMAVDGTGKVVAVYDKIHLVPFGEYLPYQDFLESLGIMQMTGVRGGFSVGAGPRVLEVPGVAPALPLICYEIIFPSEVRPVRNAGAEGAQPGWLLNVTNDAWFGSSAGPYQHFLQARVRAVELGLPLVRAANTGISAVVDPWGRIVASIDLDTKGIRDVRLPADGPTTFYAKQGLRTELLTLGFSLLGWIVCGMWGRRRRLTG
ncbi:MAG: apolipoprotein N-acyltransferase [Methyloceanibacter sp.]|nr:apolipoprotein N-acyltransferase [Methyloceanibacter sp.]